MFTLNNITQIFHDETHFDWIVIDNVILHTLSFDKLIFFKS